MRILLATTLLVLAQAAPAPAAAPGRFRVAVAPTAPGNPRNGEGDIVELKDKSLLLAYTKWTGGGGDWDNAELVGRISKDGGHQWGPEFVIQKNDAKRNVAGLSLLRLPAGKIMLAYGRVNSSDDAFTVVRFSEDEGRTWSLEVLANPEAGYEFQENDKSVLLSDGRLLSPVCWTPNIDKDGNLKSFCYYSDDGGSTWQRGKGMVAVPQYGSGAQEPAVVELSSGRLMMIFRSSGGYVGRAYSTDRGDTWSAPEMIKELPSPCAPMSIERIPGSKDLLLIWENNPRAPKGDGARTPLSSAISRDDGQTWEHIRNLAEDPAVGYGYTSITFVGNRVLLTYYEQLANLVFESIPLSWFYGK
jgi:sialidase-1